MQTAQCGGEARVAKLQSTKLIQSVRRNDIGRLEDILRHGVTDLVNLLHPTYASSPLIVAAGLGYVTVLDRLLDHGADPDLKDTQGRTFPRLRHIYGRVQSWTWVTFS